MNIFKRFYGWLKNDWEIQYTQTGVWEISGWDDWDQRNYNENKYCRFNFEYSKYLDKWRLNYNGYKPTEHHLYNIFVNNFDDYIITLSDPEKKKQHLTSMNSLNKINSKQNGKI